MWTAPERRPLPSTTKSAVIFDSSIRASAAEASSSAPMVRGLPCEHSPAVRERSAASFSRSRRKSPSEMTPAS